MKPSEIRRSLLDEHARLRSLVDEARRLLEVGAAAAGAGPGLRAGLERLTAELVAHNDHEMKALEAWLRDLDAWGPARAELLGESHEQEHAGLVAALIAATDAADLSTVAARVHPALDGLMSHMVREEDVLLSEEVLRDDEVIIEYFGG